MAWHDRGMAWYGYGMAGHVNVGVWYWYNMAWSGIFPAFLGRGPRAFCFGNFFGISTEIGKISSIIFI